MKGRKSEAKAWCENIFSATKSIYIAECGRLGCSDCSSSDYPGRDTSSNLNQSWCHVMGNGGSSEHVSWSHAKSFLLVFATRGYDWGWLRPCRDMLNWSECGSRVGPPRLPRFMKQPNQRCQRGVSIRRQILPVSCVHEAFSLLCDSGVRRFVKPSHLCRFTSRARATFGIS